MGYAGSIAEASLHPSGDEGWCVKRGAYSRGAVLTVHSTLEWLRSPDPSVRVSVEVKSISELADADGSKCSDQPELGDCLAFWL